MYITVTSEKKMPFPTSKRSDLHKELAFISSAAREQGDQTQAAVVQAAASQNTKRRRGCTTGLVTAPRQPNMYIPSWYMPSLNP